MPTAAVRESALPVEAKSSVRDVMLRVVRRRFEADHDATVDTAELFKDVTSEVGQGSGVVKPIDLSRALLDLMDERVVKWDRTFRLVSASKNAAER